MWSLKHFLILNPPFSTFSILSQRWRRWGTTTEAHSRVLLLLQRLVVHALYFDQLYCFTCKLFISFCSLVQRPWSKGGFTTGGRQMTKAAYSGGVPPPKHKVFPPKIPLCQSLIYVTFPKQISNIPLRYLITSKHKHSLMEVYLLLWNIINYIPSSTVKEFDYNLSSLSNVRMSNL